MAAKIFTGNSGSGFFSIRSGWIAVAIMLLQIIIEKLIPSLPSEWTSGTIGMVVVGLVVLIYNILRKLQGGTSG